jgi:hypothetical protein
VSISVVLSFLVGVVVGSTLSILGLSLCLRKRDQSTDGEWLFSAGVDAPLTTEILEERSKVNILLAEQRTSSSDQLEIDTHWSPPSFRQVLLGLGSQKDSFTATSDTKSQNAESYALPFGPTEEDA